MIDPKLSHICKLIDTWCLNHHVQYDIVCDETDLQGIMLFKKNQEVLNDLVRSLYPSILEGNIFVQAKPVRGGVVMAFSLNALSETKISTMIENAGQMEDTMTFKDRIESAFNMVINIEHQAKNLPSVPTDTPIDFIAAAANLVKEAQRQSPLFKRRGLGRSSVNNMRGPGGQSSHGANKGATKGATTGSTNGPVADGRQRFDIGLNEALDGLATTDGKQPDELFKTFARALRVLGTKLGIGPLQDKLKQQGISWKQSDDGQSIVLTVTNDLTKAEQPIATINYETLQTPSEFEEQLKNMLDLATGQAPGAFSSQEREVKDRKTTIKNIAQAIKPVDQEGEVAQMMNKPADAGIVAAATAAMPKEALERKLNESTHGATSQVQNTLRRLEAHHGYTAKFVRHMGEGISLYNIGGMHYRIRGDGTIL